MDQKLSSLAALQKTNPEAFATETRALLDMLGDYATLCHEGPTFSFEDDIAYFDGKEFSDEPYEPYWSFFGDVTQRHPKFKRFTWRNTHPEHYKDASSDFVDNNAVQNFLIEQGVVSYETDNLDSEGSNFCCYFETEAAARDFIDRLNRFVDT